MKVCPNCNQTYTDEALNFCLNDGATLTNLRTDEPPPTIQMNTARATSPNFADPPSQQQPDFMNQPNFGNDPLSNWQNQSMSPNQSQQPYMAPPMMGAHGQNQVLPTVSLVLGIVGLVLICCWGGIPFGLGALVTGYLGMNNANNNPTQYGGRGLAIAGMVLGGASVALGVIMLLLLIAGNLGNR
ncbi:MAG TPA: DUF4190 domain-containing protein [Pyrinomonadaceae bacterium]|nr:DUF4190 domain-containing protein [Pyrinomonadaceae bacterium]